MGDNMKLIVAGMVKGLKDSILGIMRVFQLDNDLEQEREERETQEPAQMSTLAKRRAEKMKVKETKKEREPKVIHRILMCCGWNGGVFLLSILVFNGLVLPGLKLLTHLLFGGSETHGTVWSWIGPVLSWTFSALWILPLFVLSKIVNSLWFQDIADAAYRKARGRPQLLPSLSKIIADILFSLLLQALFLIQAMLVSQLPIAGLNQLLYLLHLCLLYSLYTFEYKWFNMGWEVHKRLSYIECNWPYFVGFGLPLALLTSLPSSHVVSGCVFSILFPLFIVSGNEAEPIQQTFDFPLRLFAVVVAISNAVFQHSIKKTGVSSVGSERGGSQSGSRPGTPAKTVRLQTNS